MTELWPLIQATAGLWLVLGLALSLWPLDWALRRVLRWWEARAEQRVRNQRLAQDGTRR